MAMRALRRNLDYARRSRLVDDTEFRRAEQAKAQRRYEEQEVREFLSAYEEAYTAIEQLPQFQESPAGAFFPVPVNIYMQGARAIILNTPYYGTLYRTNGIGGLVPIEDVLQWNPLAEVYAYHPPLPVLEPYNPYVVVERSRDRFM